MILYIDVVQRRILMADFKLSEKDYSYCLDKLTELHDSYERTRDPHVKLNMDHYAFILKNSKVADLSAMKDKHVLIGDYVTVAIDDGFGEDEPETYQLTLDLFNSKSDNVSLRSPLGESIYLQKIGSLCKYEVNNNSLTVRILSKENVSEDCDSAEKV